MMGVAMRCTCGYETSKSARGNVQVWLLSINNFYELIGAQLSTVLIWPGESKDLPSLSGDDAGMAAR